jgi:hypothetical protein
MKNFLSFAIIAAIAVIFSSCSKNYEGLQPASLSETLTRYNWQVSLVQPTNQGYVYNQSTLSFDERGLASLQWQTNQALGKWSIVNDNISLQLTATDAMVQHLNRHWQLEKQNTTTILLRSMDPSGELLLLTKK